MMNYPITHRLVIPNHGNIDPKVFFLYRIEKGLIDHVKGIWTIKIKDSFDYSFVKESVKKYYGQW